jgi:anti-sigma B factor antagonist
MLRIELDHPRPHQDVVVLTAIGEIDSLTAGRLSAALHRELEHDPALLVLDLTGVSFLSVAGVTVLDCATGRAVCANVPFVLVTGDSRVITTALRHAELAPGMPTFRTVAQAVSAVESLVDKPVRHSLPVDAAAPDQSARATRPWPGARF